MTGWQNDLLPTVRHWHRKRCIESISVQPNYAAAFSIMTLIIMTISIAITIGHSSYRPWMRCFAFFHCYAEFSIFLVMLSVILPSVVIQIVVAPFLAFRVKASFIETSFFKFAWAGYQTRDLLAYFHLFSLTLPLSYTVALLCRTFIFKVPYFIAYNVHTSIVRTLILQPF